MNAFAHSQLLKGLPLRQIQFSDLSILEPEDSPNFPILTTSLFNGRKKRLGVSQNVGAVRAVDWENCSFGALAFYLFWRSVMLLAGDSIMLLAGFSGISANFQFSLLM